MQPACNREATSGCVMDVCCCNKGGRRWGSKQVSRGGLRTKVTVSGGLDRPSDGFGCVEDWMPQGEKLKEPQGPASQRKRGYAVFLYLLDATVGTECSTLQQPSTARCPSLLIGINQVHNYHQCSRLNSIDGLRNRGSRGPKQYPRGEAQG